MPLNLISQPSTFFATQASKNTWPRTVFMLMQGLDRWGDLSFRSCRDSNSLLFWSSDELGRKKWSFGPTATLPKLWFEATAAFWRSQIKVEICIFSMLDFSPSFWIFSRKTETACSSNSVKAVVHCVDWCSWWPVTGKRWVNWNNRKRERRGNNLISSKAYRK